MVEKCTFNSLARALVDIPAVSMSIVHTLKTWDICGIVEWSFVTSTRRPCVMIMLVFQLLDMICQEKEKCSLTGCTHICAQNLIEISILCVWKMSGIFYFNSWNMSPILYMLHFIFLFNVVGCWSEKARESLACQTNETRFVFFSPSSALLRS